VQVGCSSTRRVGQTVAKVGRPSSSSSKGSKIYTTGSRTHPGHKTTRVRRREWSWGWCCCVCCGHSGNQCESRSGLRESTSCEARAYNPEEGTGLGAHGGKLTRQCAKCLGRISCNISHGLAGQQCRITLDTRGRGVQNVRGKPCQQNP
jgi:hypothetical protein